MNSNVMPSIVQMEAELLRQLVLEVKETVALDIDINNDERMLRFHAVDLWNIQRKMKSASRIARKRIF